MCPSNTRVDSRIDLLPSVVGSPQRRFYHGQSSDIVIRIADEFRGLPNAHRGPFGILALRSEGLLYSKHDEYTDANLIFIESRERRDRFYEHMNRLEKPGLLTEGLGLEPGYDYLPDRSGFESAYAEVKEQLLVGASGTYDRITEHYLRDPARSSRVAHQVATPSHSQRGPKALPNLV